jgi:hypothetical protein
MELFEALFCDNFHYFSSQEVLWKSPFAKLSLFGQTGVKKG